MKIDLRKSSSGEETEIPLEYSLDFSDSEVDFQHPFCEPVSVLGVFSNFNGLLELKALLKTNLHLSCQRCNTAFTEEKEVSVDLLLSCDTQDPGSDTIYKIEGTVADLDEIFYESFLLDMDTKFLCTQDCRGLCHKCGANLNETSCNCEKSEVDQRLAALEALLE